MKKLDKDSLNLVKENIEKLKEIFPDVFTEEGIDFEKLRESLGEFVEESDEKYQFTWFGKKEANKISLTPTNATLRPDKESSKNWDSTKNIYIEGDNLEVLKVLQKTYYKKIKMIYIDPPYNTGKDFIYKDNYQDNLKNYLAMTGQIDEEGNPLTTNTEKSGRKHSNWLNMMYPRLKLARNLLKDDGVVFVSIDDNEVHNLRKIMDEIFGEENFRNSILVRRRVKSLNIQFADKGLKSLNVGYEYILVYSRTDKFTFKAMRMKKEKVSPKGTWNVFWSNADRPTMRYELFNFTPKTGQWRWSKEKALEAIRNYEEYMKNYSKHMTLEEYWEKTGKKLKFVRKIKDGRGKNGGVQYWVPPNETSLRTSNWMDIEVSQIKKDFDIPFDNPKSVNLIKTILSTIEEKNFIVLDFFSGSATTAHAVMELNAEDGGNRQFILVQLPEPTDEKSEACKAGYKNICEIGKERIRRAGEKIKEDYKDKEWIDSLDIGFKVFKLDSTNIKEWDSNPDNLEKSLLDYGDFIKPDRSEEDLLYEVLLKYGIDLTAPIEEKEINGKKVYIVGFGSLIVYFDEIDIEIAKEMVNLVKEYESDFSVLVLKDDGFATSRDKVNIVEFFKQMNLFEKIITL